MKKRNRNPRQSCLQIVSGFAFHFQCARICSLWTEFRPGKSQMYLSRNSVPFVKSVGIFSLLLFILSLASAHATVVFSDTFSYPDGAITNVSGGVWIEHSAGAVCQITSGQAQVSSTAAEDVHAALSGQPFSSGTLYASFTIKCTALPNSSGGYFAHFNTGSNHRCVVWSSIANAGSSKFRLGIGNTSGATASSGQLTTDLALNTSYFVVIRYDVATSLSTIWLNPSQ